MFPIPMPRSSNRGSFFGRSFKKLAETKKTQREAAKNAVSYYQRMITSLELRVNDYAADHPGTPELAKLQENLAAAKAGAFEGGDRSISSVLMAIDSNKPGAIPTIEYPAGTTSVAAAAQVDAGDAFESWTEGSGGA